MTKRGFNDEVFTAHTSLVVVGSMGYSYVHVRKVSVRVLFSLSLGQVSLDQVRLLPIRHCVVLRHRSAVLGGVLVLSCI